jgi:5-methylcytosine-specific restriction endonuclease McrA
MKVFVLSKEGIPLMPTTPRRARVFLKEKQARVVRREPFTIRLRFATKAYVQEVVVGVDTGSKDVGVASTTYGEVVFQAEVHLRDDITEKLIQRSLYRRSRRTRKTRYRVVRWRNRRRSPGWLAPSIRSKAEATVKSVRFVSTLLPVSQVKVEVGSFDTQKMQNPEISGLEYQQGQLEGYQIKEYVLRKWQHQCVYCGARDVPLQIEHIFPKARGGTDRPSNLTLACGPCNLRKGKQTATEFGFPDVQAKACVPLKDAAHVSSLKSRVIQDLQKIFGESKVRVAYGYETKYKRIQVLDLPKSHTNDAVAIACEMGEEVKSLETVYRIRCFGRGQYQRFNGLRSEHKCWAPSKVRGFKLYELVKAKGAVGYIAGRREKGAFVIKDVASRKKLVEVTARKLERIARPAQGLLITHQPASKRIRKEGGTSSPR